MNSDSKMELYERRAVEYGDYVREDASETVTKYIKEAGSDLYRYLDDGREDAETVRIMCAGDLMCEKSLIKSVHQNGKYHFELSFSKVAEVFKKADFAIANLETTVTDKAPYTHEKSEIDDRFHYNAPLEYLDAIKYAGFDAVTLANNHAADCGARGVADTINNIESKGLMCTGAFKDDEQCRFLMVEIKGINIAILSYTQYFNSDIDIEYFTEEGRNVMLNRYEPEKVKNDIAAAKEAGAEFIICYMHFVSRQYSHQITEMQQRTAKDIADMGVDCIMGSHPRAIQPYDEIITDDGRTVPVVYSLGSLITSDSKSMITRTSVIYELFLTRNNGKVEIARQAYIPCKVVEMYKKSSFIVFPTPPKWRDGNENSLLRDAETAIEEVMGTKIDRDANR